MLSDLKWLAVDFDGTIANTSGHPDYKILEPIEENVAKLRKCADKGFKIVIHTSRHWENYQEVEQWLDTQQIPYKSIVMGKLLAHRYIDDKAIPADADWEDYL